MALRDLIEQCTFVTGVEAPGDGTVHCALAFLDDVTGAWVGKRRDDGYDELTFTGRAAGGPLELSPERGIGGAMGAVGEAELDDKFVDDAWVIRGEPGLLVAMKPELAMLAELGVATVPKITLNEGSLVVEFKKLVDEATTKRAVEGTLALWHRIAFHNA